MELNILNHEKIQENDVFSKSFYSKMSVLIDLSLKLFINSQLINVW